jgi:dolichol-phosphate mannosyltransferase
MDSDMQDPVVIAAEMITQWEDWYEVVYARRKNRNDNFIKKQTALIYYKLLSKISDTKIPRNVWDFRLIDKKVLTAFLSLKEKDRYIRGMFAWLGFKTTFVDFDRPERIHGETWYTWKKMIQLAMDGILNFSMFPLRIGFLIGVFMIFLSFIFLCYMMVGTILAWDIVYYQLYKWISVVGFWVMWLQFIFIWILWEYVGRVYNETRERPLYIVSEELNIK